MHGIHCRLYDESIVKNIMMTAALAALEYAGRHQAASEEELCAYMEAHADSLISETIAGLESAPEETADGELPDFFS